MRAWLPMVAALLWQMASISANDPVADPRHMRYERKVELPPGAGGQACVVLDAAVFGHAANESLNDLRLYALAPGKAATETPFNFSVSRTQGSEDQPAVPRNAGTSNGDVVFDLEMPQRPYSAVVLDLAARDFVATARVSGSDGDGGKATDLGTFVLFDLSGQHLSRFTTLPLQESTFAELHVALHLMPAPGSAMHDLGPSIVRSATAPPSREAQTLFTTVAQAAAFTHRGHAAVATIHIPAHVPVERVSFTPDPKFSGSFLHSVHITATPDGTPDPSAVEIVSGEISHVKFTGASGLGIDQSQLSVEAVLGANLRTGAEIQIVIEGDNGVPLPVASVQLEMRQRKICFDASPQAGRYLLMYGDAALHAPDYDYSRDFVPAPNPVAAALGGEEKTAGYLPRRDRRPYTERHPELLWVGLLSVLGVLGSIALRSTRRQSQHRRRNSRANR